MGDLRGLAGIPDAARAAGVVERLELHVARPDPLVDRVEREVFAADDRAHVRAARAVERQVRVHGQPMLVAPELAEEEAVRARSPEPPQPAIPPPSASASARRPAVPRVRKQGSR